MIAHMDFTLLFQIWFGSFCAMAYSVTAKDFKGLQPLLTKLFPKMGSRWLAFLEILITPIVGALFTYCIMQPNNMKDAVLEGLTWSGTFVAFANNKEG